MREMIQMTERTARLLLAPNGVNINEVNVRAKLFRSTFTDFEVHFKLGNRTIIANGCDSQLVDAVADYVPEHFDEVYEFWKEYADEGVIGIIAEDILPSEILSTL